MIVVQDVGGLGTLIQRINGNPTLDSLDGEVRAPLEVILHETWFPEDRAKFGIYLVEQFEVPVGKMAIGEPIYRRDGDVVTETYVVVDKPEPQPYVTLEMQEAKIIELEARIAALEARL